LLGLIDVVFENQNVFIVEAVIAHQLIARRQLIAMRLHVGFQLRRALLDAFEEHGLLAYTKPEPEIAVDELGRLRKTVVNKVLEDFDENVRSRIVSVLEELHAIA